MEFDELAKMEEIILTTEEVEFLRASIFESEQATGGCTPFKCAWLDDPLSPIDISDIFLPAIGDIFHAIDCPKVYVQAEVKKSYLVALRNAFFI